MKKLFLMIVCCLTAIVCHADNEVSVKSGNLAAFLLKETATMEIDYSKAKVNGTTLDAYLKSRGEDFVRDWPDDAKKAREYFIGRFNKKNKNGMQITREDNAKYKIVFQIRYLDMGNGGSSFIPFASAKAGGIIVSGLMEVVNTETNKSLCCVDVQEVKGLGHVSETVRLGLCYFEVASKIFKLAKKADTSVELEETDRLTGSINTVKASTKAAPKVTASSKTAATKASKATNGTKKAVTGKQTNTNVKAAAVTTKTQAPVTVAEEETADESPFIIKQFKNVKALDYPNKKKPYIGNFKLIAQERRIGAYVDFSDADIDGRMEKDFIKYMTTSADDRERDAEFATKWENEIKPELASLVTTTANKEIKDEKLRLRFSSELDTHYILKMSVVSVNDDGDNIIDYMFIDSTTGKIVAQLQCEAKGGHVGRYIGLLKQGFESAGEEFSKLLLKQID